MSEPVHPALTAEELWEQAPCGYLATAPDGRILRVNRTFLTWTGLPRERVLAGRVQDLLTIGGRVYFETHCAPMLRMQGLVREIAVEILCKDGHRLPVLMNAVLHKTTAGEPAAVHMTVLDATERRAYEQRLVEARDAERCARVLAEELQERLREANAALERLASLDALTGVENRRALEQHLQRLTARARRHGALYGVALVDVDHFKAFNDAHGHDAGDAVLQIVAGRIRDCIREEDVVGRWGGEEFMVLTPDIEPEGVAELAERIRGAIGSAPVWHQGLELGVTVSVGWAAWPDASGEGIVRRADQALYGAKGAGRDRVAAAPAELLAAPA